MNLPPLSRWPAVSVVIPARDCAGTLEAAVRSVLEQRFDGSLEVVIAAAPSADDTEAVAARLSHDHPRIRYRSNRAGTTPAGLNLAIATARGDVIVRLDAHAELPAGYVARALEVLRETGAGNVGGMQVPVAETPFGRAVAVAMSSPLGAGGARYRIGGEPGPVETVYLGVFRREALEAVGGYDEALVRNQDFELNHRLRRAGSVVYFHPDLRVGYRPRSTPGQLWRQYFDYGVWKRRVVRMHPGSVKPRQVLPPLLVIALTVAVAASVTLATPWPALVLVLAYGAAVTAAGLAGVAGRDPDGSSLALALRVAVALATMHLAWGLGFLVGRRRGGGGPTGPGAVDDNREGGPASWR